jgi:hypothetical protein
VRAALALGGMTRTAPKHSPGGERLQARLVLHGLDRMGATLALWHGRGVDRLNMKFSVRRSGIGRNRSHRLTRAPVSRALVRKLLLRNTQESCRVNKLVTC